MLSVTSKSQSFIKSFDHGVYTDHNFVYPYTQAGLTLFNNLYFELGMLDLPTEVSLNFNNTVQNRAGQFSYLINNLEEPAYYRGPKRNKELYYSVGLSTQHKRYRQILQMGFSYGELMVKTSNYYRAIDVSRRLYRFRLTLPVRRKKTISIFWFFLGH